MVVDGMSGSAGQLAPSEPLAKIRAKYELRSSADGVEVSERCAG